VHGAAALTGLDAPRNTTAVAKHSRATTEASVEGDLVRIELETTGRGSLHTQS
jgi:hypothetical protein